MAWSQLKHRLERQKSNVNQLKTSMHSRPLCSTAMSGQSHLGNLVKHSQTLTVGLLRAFDMLVDVALQEESQGPFVSYLYTLCHTIRPAPTHLLQPSLTTEQGTVLSLMTTHSVHLTLNLMKMFYSLCLFLVIKFLKISRPYFFRAVYGHTTSTHF